VLGHLAPWMMRARQRPAFSIGAGRAFLPFARPGTFLCVSFFVRNALILVVRYAEFPMAKKTFPKMPVKKKPSSRVARSLPTESLLRAHPCLIHGFIVRLAASPTLAIEAAKIAVTAVARDKGQAQGPSETKYEGTTDGATFH
jgi:hypothetical protein